MKTVSWKCCNNKPVFIIKHKTLKPWETRTLMMKKHAMRIQNKSSPEPVYVSHVLPSFGLQENGFVLMKRYLISDPWGNKCYVFKNSTRINCFSFSFSSSVWILREPLSFGITFLWTRQRTNLYSHEMLSDWLPVEREINSLWIAVQPFFHVIPLVHCGSDIWEVS